MRYANIQALRFAAASVIVVYHLGYQAALQLHLSGPVIDFLKADCLGLSVYVFFAISGFVLAHSLRTTPPAQFLIWRAARLYLPYWCALVPLFAINWAAGSPLPVDRRFVNSLFLLPVGPGWATYYLGGIEWTLVYEVFFGVVLGICALAGPRRGVTGGAALWLLLCLIKAVVAPAGVSPHPTWGTIALSPINVPFLLGVLACELRGRGLEIARMVAPVAFPGLIVAGQLIPRMELSLIVQAAGCASAVVWCAASRQLDARHPLVRYGDWSYGIYLLHFRVIVLVFAFAANGVGLPSSLGTVAGAGFAALAIGLTYGYAESTGYRWLRQRFAAKRPVVALAVPRAAARSSVVRSPGMARELSVRLTNIQALRFVAALAVLLLHLRLFSRTFLGVTHPVLDIVGAKVLDRAVYVFFAISGYVLALGLRTTPVPQFLAWRFVRLWMPYWGALAIICGVFAAVGIPLPPTRPFVNAILLLPVGLDRVCYLLGNLEWTLVYEQFLGVAIGLCALAGPRRGVIGAAAIWLGLCVAKAVVWPSPFAAFPTWKTIVLSPANVSFLLGVLATELHGRTPRWAMFAAFAAFPILIYAGYFAPRNDLKIVIQGVGCAALIVGCAAARQLSVRNVLVRLGDCSYGVYLWHSFLIVMMFRYGRAYEWLPVTVRGAAAVGVIALALGLLYGWLESNAYRRLRRRFAAKRVMEVEPLRQAA